MALLTPENMYEQIVRQTKYPEYFTKAKVARPDSGPEIPPGLLGEIEEAPPGLGVSKTAAPAVIGPEGPDFGDELLRAGLTAGGAGLGKVGIGTVTGLLGGNKTPTAGVIGGSILGPVGQALGQVALSRMLGDSTAGKVGTSLGSYALGQASGTLGSTLGNLLAGQAVGNVGQQFLGNLTNYTNLLGLIPAIAGSFSKDPGVNAASNLASAFLTSGLSTGWGSAGLAGMGLSSALGAFAIPVAMVSMLGQALYGQHREREKRRDIKRDINKFLGESTGKFTPYLKDLISGKMTGGTPLDVLQKSRIAALQKGTGLDPATQGNLMRELFGVSAKTGMTPLEEYLSTYIAPDHGMRRFTDPIQQMAQRMMYGQDFLWRSSYSGSPGQPLTIGGKQVDPLEMYGEYLKYMQDPLSKAGTPTGDLAALSKFWQDPQARNIEHMLRMAGPAPSLTREQYMAANPYVQQALEDKAMGYLSALPGFEERQSEFEKAYQSEVDKIWAPLKEKEQLISDIMKTYGGAWQASPYGAGGMESIPGMGRKSYFEATTPLSQIPGLSEMLEKGIPLAQQDVSKISLPGFLTPEEIAGLEGQINQFWGSDQATQEFRELQRQLEEQQRSYEQSQMYGGM